MCVSNACDAYSDTWNNHYDIYDFLGYHIRNNQTKKIGSGTFAVCKNHGTRQRCQSLPCAKTMAHGKDLNFAVCHVCRAHVKYLATSSFLAGYFILKWVENGTRQTLCRVPHTATRHRQSRPLPCATLDPRQNKVANQER